MATTVAAARSPGSRRLCVATVSTIALVVGAAGCSTTQYVKLRKAPKNPLSDQLGLAAWSGPKPSERSLQMLRRYDAVGDLKGDPRQLVAKFQKIVEREPSIDLLYTTGELAYIAGKKLEPKDEEAALECYETAVACAYIFLFDEQFGPVRNPYDPNFRGACDLYNTALEGTLRMVKKHGKLTPGTVHRIQAGDKACELSIQIRSRHWNPDDFERFEFASDFEVQGLTNQYHTFGLGVPMIAVRKSHPAANPSERYYPPDLSFPVTAFLRVVPTADPTASPAAAQQVVLELFDPLESTDVELLGRRVPLESDASTALAYYLSNPQLKLDKLSTVGLLRPDLTEAVTGLYMLQPYDPDKIPVVMIHGLWSSPLTWMEMFNDLRCDPQLSDNYQFWFYLYPSGQPFWASGTRFRDDLAQLRATIDPELRNPLLDEMVLVGHSMGGLVAKLQTVDSRDDYWRIVSDQPFQSLKATPDDRVRLEKLFYFHANPSIRRVVTIATPHRGSEFANDTTKWLAHKFITLPQMTMLNRDQFVKENPGVFRDPGLLEVKTSIDSLDPKSPILPVLLESPSPPTVVYHNIVGVVPKKGYFGKSEDLGGDGVVDYESAHLDRVASEIVVNADHVSIHRHPAAILEVRRILLEHLAQVRVDARPPPPAFEVSTPAGTPPAPWAWSSSPELIQPLPAVDAAP